MEETAKVFGLKKFVSDALFVSIILLVILKIFTQLPLPVATIVSESMVPTLNKGDIVVWIPADINNARVGDIVVFKGYDGKYIAHRVVAITEINGERALITKGDANEYPDQYGPHVPLPYVTRKNFVGIVVTIFGFPLKIPYVGLIFIYAGQFLTFPSVAPFAISLIFLASVLGSESKPRKISLKKLFMIAFIIFLIICASTMLFAKNVSTVKIGVGEYAGEGAINYATPGKEYKVNVTLSNPGFTPLKCVVISQNVRPEDRIFVINPGETKSQSVYVKAPEKKGVYNVKIETYSSPFWILLPDSMVLFFSQYSLLGIFTLHIITALELTAISVLIAGTVMYVGEYLTTRKLLRMARKKREFLEPYPVDTRPVHWGAIISAIISMGIAYFFGYWGFVALFLLTPILLYYAKCRWSQQFIIGGVEATILFVSLYTLSSLIYNFTPWYLLLLIAVILLVSAILGTILSLFSLAVAKLIMRVRSIKDPLVVLEGDL